MLKQMGESSGPTIFEAKIKGVTFGLATRQEIYKASISECPISHAGQLSNSFLGLPLETGKCDSCGTGDPGQCEGHFGYIELPTPIYHPDHVSELKRMLSLLCLKCLKMKNRKVKNIGIIERVLSSCCEETLQISINEVKTTEGACYLELKIPSKSRPREGVWSFLEKYGYRYGNAYSRPLLPSEVLTILKKIPKETRKKLCAKGYFLQDGYIIQCLPVPPNCLSVPDVSDGISTTSTDYSMTLLKKVMRQVEIIKNSRSGMPNFESQEIESNDLQAAVVPYLQFRGTGKAARDVDNRFGLSKEVNASSITKAWLQKMKTLFIRKGSGFSSRSVITGDSFKGVSEIGLPFEVAQKITFEERVNQHNMDFLQKLVDEKLCLTYKDGQSTYSLKEGSKGHTFLRPGQVVHRRIMDGDIVFINRPPTTHKHSLQALSVYIHDDHTVKINPLICSPLSADFDGDCIHLFYPQSLEAKAEVAELFSVEKQLLSSHTGNFNLQLTTDSLLSLKKIFKKCFLSKAKAQQLAMFVPFVLQKPAVEKSKAGPLWTASQILQTTLPPSLNCTGERYMISESQILSLDSNWDVMASVVSDVVTSLFFLKGPKEVLGFFNSVQPLLMENLYSEGSSVSLRDFYISQDVLENIQANIRKISSLLHLLRTSHSESIALQLESCLRTVKIPVTNFILKSSALGHLVDSKSESALSKVVQQIGYLGMQISDKGKFYSGMLVKEMSSLFLMKYPSGADYPAEEFGLVGRPLFQGLNPYQEMVHSISSREVIVRSSRGLTEPGTLFKNLMAILRDVVICYDGTVRNMCSNLIIQFEYGVNSTNIASEFCAGDPVGVLAATAMSNPAYKAVLDSSPSSNSSWDMMKEILLCGVRFKNDISDRRVILYLNDCGCGRKHCQENAALIAKNHLKKVSLKDTAMEFLIEYRSSQLTHESHEINPGLVGHIHLNKTQLTQSNISMLDIFEKCQATISLHQRRKKVGNLFKRVEMSFSDCCSFCQSSTSKCTDVPCIQFLLQGAPDDLLDRVSHILADTVYPVLLQTVIKGDPRVSTANVIWISPDTATWIRSPSKSPKGELALDVTLEKEAVRNSGDAWRVVMDLCLPILHLIDTKRSIPYAIKQVQELLGISCAFEQAVQRLSTSVTMVTKGVLKDHLLLLGNSMTCAGTLIGFNAGGIKALSRSLDVQVPFMDATLFTPRKCFEKAAEKCHSDNLSSIVASCAWGKHVNVGTGSPFEVLWDTRKAELSPAKEIDVYNFLHLVSGSSELDDLGTSCLGGEIDELNEEEFMECDPSPERESGQDKPTFEDGAEFVINGDDNDGFAKEAAKEPETSWSTWGKKAESEKNDWTKKGESSTWGTAGAKTPSDHHQETEDGSSWAKAAESGGGGWGAKTTQDSASGNLWEAKVSNQTTHSKPSTTWGTASDHHQETEDGSNWAKVAESGGGGWGAKTTQDSASGNLWEAKVSNQTTHSKPSTTWGTASDHHQETEDGSSWAKAAESGGGGWGAKTTQDSASGNLLEAKVFNQTTHSKPSTTWGTASDHHQETEDGSSWAKAAESGGGGWGGKTTQDSASGNLWEAKVSNQTTYSKPSTTWGTASDHHQETEDGSSWAKAAESGGGGWGAKTTQDSASGNLWEAKVSNQTTHSKPSTTWGTASDHHQETEDGSSWAKAAESGGGGWGAKTTQDSASGNLWEAKVSNQTTHSKPSTTWGTASDWKKVDAQSSTGQEKESKDWGSASDWGQKKESEVRTWDSASQNQFNNSTVSQDEKDVGSQWGQGRGRGRGRVRGRGGRGRENFRGRGPSNTGDWRNDKSRTDDPNTPGIFTVNRQRLDTFTVEEQDILSETELIMKNIRKIISQTGYTDGDPLPPDDQKYIIDNVLSHHPDKSAKMGAGIDYIMINKHQEFQDSRCFYTVSVNGSKEDFSYRKCLENFLREKYPDKAETFIPKYFRKLQPRSGWNRDRGAPMRPGAGTSGWNRDSIPPSTPDETGTPSRNMDQNLAREDSGTPGWNNDRTPGPEDASTPGWN